MHLPEPDILIISGKSMADALALLLKQLFNNINNMRYRRSSIVALDDDVRKVAVSFIISLLIKMMRGYENEQVQGLFRKMERISYGRFDPEVRDELLEICEELCDIRYGSNMEGEEHVVGFDEEVETLLDQLTGTSTKQLQIFSIAGMAGLGKTTLARKLYRDPLIEYVFDVRAWTCVSQVYLKRDLLLGILNSFNDEPTDEIYEMSDEQLGGKLYRLLKGQKYLVVLDDIWECQAWNDIKMYFPDDKTGSRVLFTSRDINMSLHVQAARPAHVLRLRTAAESWDIFQKKVFRTGICFHRLEIIGKEITKKCEGLPLAIIITAGLLKNKWSPAWWMQLSGDLHSFMVRDPSQYMDSLALSYNHLPPHLKQCFLFLGVFPEDYDIPVTKLIWLWVAQGFINQTGSRTLEDVAEDCLMDLIKRSLLMTVKKRADGQIRACRIHDLLRDLCLRKAKEENFPLNIYRYGQAPAPASSNTITNNVYMSWNPPPASSNTITNEFSLHSRKPRPELRTHSGLCFGFELGKILQEGRSILSEKYKSIRILDLESIFLSLFPSDVIQLVHLRYLAIQARDGSPQASISNLVNLQMLIILSRKNIVVPKTIWDMVNLRHINIKPGQNLIKEPCFRQVTEKDSCPSPLVLLQTLSLVCPQSCWNIFSSTPNLRKLGFCGPLISRLGDLEFPNIGSLQHLQKLKLLNTIVYPEATRSCNPIVFPENLKKLTLSNTGMDWEEMWSFSLLPNLEVLKLKFHACIGERWETSDAEFQRLKILKLHDLDLRQWVSSSDNFPALQRLVVHCCLKLNSIPLGLGNIWTLEVIEVSGCSRSAHASALQIQKEQESEGNCYLKVHATNNHAGVSLMHLEPVRSSFRSKDEGEG